MPSPFESSDYDFFRLDKEPSAPKRDQHGVGGSGFIGSVRGLLQFLSCLFKKPEPAPERKRPARFIRRYPRPSGYSSPVTRPNFEGELPRDHILRKIKAELNRKPVTLKDKPPLPSNKLSGG